MEIILIKFIINEKEFPHHHNTFRDDLKLGLCPEKFKKHS